MRGECCVGFAELRSELAGDEKVARGATAAKRVPRQIRRCAARGQTSNIPCLSGLLPNSALNGEAWFGVPRLRGADRLKAELRTLLATNRIGMDRTHGRCTSLVNPIRVPSCPFVVELNLILEARAAS